jgi:hypothetical protein
MSIFEILGTECTTSKCSRPDEISCPCRVNDRDSRSIRFAFGRDDIRRTVEPVYGGCRRAAWGTGLRNVPYYGNESPFVNELEGNTCGAVEVQMGYSSYRVPQTNRYDYKFYNLSGWRVAVPRAINDRTKMAIIQKIYYYGPEAAGYVRVKDSLVPAHLGPGDRMMLAESSVNAEIIMPLSI